MKKIFISSDIEGISGISHWDEADKTHMDYPYFQNIMTEEVYSMCKTAEKYKIAVTVRDAHHTARNIIHEKLPQNTRLIRGFNGNPDCMMAGLDSTFDFAVLHGYHSCAYSSSSPLAHTLSSKKISRIKINGKTVGETTISIYASALKNVPVCYVIGDKGAVEEAQSLNKNIVGTITKEGTGNCVTTIHPKFTQEKIEIDIQKAIEKFIKCKDNFRVFLPEKFNVEIEYLNHSDAYRGSFYPNAKQISPKSIEFVSNNFWDVLTMFEFCAM